MLTITIYGASGAGKTFAMMKVLLPALAAAGYEVRKLEDDDSVEPGALSVNVEPPASAVT